MKERVTDFFVNYEKANSDSDVVAIGSLYADTFMFAGPNGVQAVKKDDFLKILPKMKARFSSMGVAGTKLHSVETSDLNSKYLLARVVWTISLQHAFQSAPLEISATYILARGVEDTLSIILQIDHQDLATAIKAK